MCSSPSIPAPSAPPPPVLPAAQVPTPQVQAASASAAQSAGAAAGPMSLIFNVGGAGGLTQPANTTGGKALTGQ